MQGGVYGNALQAASSGGYQEIVVLLLNKGANVADGPSRSVLGPTSHKQATQTTPAWPIAVAS
jgi:hypothetical protein